MLPTLLDGAQEKSSTLRLRSVIAVMLALLMWNESSFERYMEQVCKMVKVRHFTKRLTRESASWVDCVG